MIVTVTPNPSVDRTVEVRHLVRGAVLRATAARVDPGGKGVNVARALAAHGHKVATVLPCGGHEGRQLAALLEPDGVGLVCVPITNAVRANISIVEPDGTVTKINEPGPELSTAEATALAAAAIEAGRKDTEWVVCSGSLPRGISASFYRDLVGVLRASGVRVAVDSSGAALAEALSSRPDLIKPNREELAEAAGMPVRTLGEAVRAATVLHGRGAATVLASLGADGALLVDQSGPHHGDAPVDSPRGAVGAGDAMLAGFLSAGGAGPTALAEALAWGAAAASLPGSRMPGPADLDRAAVRIHRHLEQDRVLRERS